MVDSIVDLGLGCHRLDQVSILLYWNSWRYLEMALGTTWRSFSQVVMSLVKMTTDVSSAV
jgi:hypothetical protein